MATGKKTGGRDIKPGQVLNPKGRPKVTEELRKARIEDKQKVEKTLRKYLFKTSGDFEKLLKNNSLTALDIIIVKLISVTMATGDEKRFGFILDRLIGKVKDEIDLTSNGNEISSAILILPANGREPPKDVEDESEQGEIEQ